MSEIFHDPEFWVLVAFVLVLILLWKKAMPGILRSLDERAARIASQLEEAKRLREEAEKTLAAYQEKQRQTMRQAEEILAHATVEAERIGKLATADLEASIERRTRQSEDRIAQAEAAALTEVRNSAVEVAIEAARRVLKSEIKGEAASRMVEDAIADLPRRLN
jgi:F-type H+-transporting ATPase subunit b